jgi:hypothetical protein
MNYWSGYMNWPLDEDWRCEICGGYYGLTWGMVHAECRCNNCHALYSMRANDEQRTVLTKPRLILRAEFIQPAKEAWAKTCRVLEKITKEEWIVFGVPAEQFEERSEA